MHITHLLDETRGYWSQITYVGEETQSWQIEISIPEEATGTDRTIDRVEVHTINANYATEQFPPPNPSTPGSPSLANAGKPSVVSRAAWGCPDGQGSRAAPDYSNVTHIVIHHTVGANSLGSGENWSDRVRAIWSYHTHTLGWGDIGYNYLVAPDGTIFEGRSGGDNVVGFHDAANYGSMGVALMGTYIDVEPTNQMQDSLIALMAWKVEQQGINPMGEAYYVGAGEVVPTIVSQKKN
jgi:hypothetical protein